LILFLCLTAFTPNQTFAYSQTLYDEAKNSNPSTLNPLAWYQNGVVPPSQTETVISGFPTRDDGEASTIQNSGCTYYAHYYMLIQAQCTTPEASGNIVKYTKYINNFTSKLYLYQNSDGKIVGTTEKKANAVTLNEVCCGQYPYGTYISFIEQTATCNTSTMVQPIAGANTLSYTETVSRAKEALNRGNFVVLYCRTLNNKGEIGGHAVFVEGVSNTGDLYIVDSCSTSRSLKNGSFKSYYEKYGGTDFCYGFFEYVIEGKDSRTLPTLTERYAEAGVGSTGSSTVTDSSLSDTVSDSMQTVINAVDKNESVSILVSATNTNLSSAISDASTTTTPNQNSSPVSEYDLEGMNMDLSSFMYSSQVTVLTSTDLTKAEKEQLANIKTDIDNGKFDGWGFIRKIFTVCGLLFCVYAILLTVASFFDIAFPVSGYGLVWLLSFTRILISDRKDVPIMSKKRVHVMTRKQFYAFVLAMFVVGLIITTGYIYDYIMGAIRLVAAIIKSARGG
jgi:hypothetical protein